MNPMSGISQAMSSPFMRDLMQLKRQGVDAQTAMNQLSGKYPQFRNVTSMLQGKSLQEMDRAGTNALKEYGINPNDAMNQFNRFM